MTMVDTHAQSGAGLDASSGPGPGEHGEYRPPVNEDELLLKWIRRARESQKSHYDMADLLAARNRMFGIGVTFSSAAASLKLPSRAAASKKRSEFSGGRRSGMERPSGVVGWRDGGGSGARARGVRRVARARD